jgi:phosphatidate phosphatase APP1
MATLKTWLTRAAAELDNQLDRRQLKRRNASGGPVRIAPFRSYGTAERLYVRGRVLANPPLPTATGKESKLRNLVDAYRRFNTNEIPNARLTATAGDTSIEIAADDEGYFFSDLTVAAPPPPGWAEVKLKLLEPAVEAEAVAHVLVPPPSCEFGIISDLDDTVIHSEVTKKVKMLKNVLFGNARTRLPFEGVAALYTALQGGSDGLHVNPLFYVSGGPWNFYDIYHDFLAAQSVPAGPILLADFGFASDLFIHPAHETHKQEKIKHIVETYPELPFILIGDSGEHDPEIYLNVAKTHPGRIRRVYIRDVSLLPTRGLQKVSEQMREIGCDMIVVTKATEAMDDAIASGLVKAPA